MLAFGDRHLACCKKTVEGHANDNRLPAEYCSWLQDTVAAGFGTVTHENPDFAQTRGKAAFVSTDDHLVASQPQICTDSPCSKMGTVAEDTIPDIVVMRCFDILHEEAILILAGITQY